MISGKIVQLTILLLTNASLITNAIKPLPIVQFNNLIVSYYWILKLKIGYFQFEMWLVQLCMYVFHPGVHLFQRGVYVLLAGVHIFLPGVHVFQHGVYLFQFGVCLFQRGVYVFHRGVYLFQRGVCYFHPEVANSNITLPFSRKKMYKSCITRYWSLEIEY
jgi:hypothetical protein